MSAASHQGTPHILRDLPRGEFFGGLFALGCASGLASRIIQSIDRLGWAEALFNTFEISAILWVSCIAGVLLVLQDRTTGLRSRDLAMAAGFLVLVVLPVGPLSWLAVAELGFYLIATTAVDSSRRGALILLAVTVPMLWSRVLFQFFAGPILRIDASLVAWILNTHRAGDMVQFADGSGSLAIMPGCSSLANVSLAFLCWVTVNQVLSHRGSACDALWCLAACASAIAVNAARMGILGLSQWHYATFHSPLGDAISSTIIFGLILCFGLLGARRELSLRI